MKKDERAELLLETFGDIGTEYILEAEKAETETKGTSEKRASEQNAEGKVRGGKKPWVRWLCAAELLCAAALIALVAVNVSRISKKNRNEFETWTEDMTDLGTTAATEDMTIFETIMIPHWEERDLIHQYGLFEYEGREYNASGAVLGEYTLGEKLGNVTLKGYDIYENKEYEAEGEIYTIEGISAECALALWFTEPAGTEYNTEYYIYINACYTPQTLGQFMEDLDFYGGLQTTVMGQIRIHGEDTGEADRIEYGVECGDKTADREVLLEQLSKYKELANVYEQESREIDWATTFMSVGVSIPLLGRDVSIWITENGYLLTNIMETAKAFYLGQDAAFDMMNALSGEETDWAHIVEVLEWVQQARKEQEAATTAAEPGNAGSADKTYELPEPQTRIQENQTETVTMETVITETVDIPTAEIRPVTTEPETTEPGTTELGTTEPGNN